MKFPERYEDVPTLEEEEWGPGFWYIGLRKPWVHFPSDRGLHEDYMAMAREYVKDWQHRWPTGELNLIGKVEKHPTEEVYGYDVVFVFKQEFPVYRG